MTIRATQKKRMSWLKAAEHLAEPHSQSPSSQPGSTSGSPQSSHLAIPLWRKATGPTSTHPNRDLKRAPARTRCPRRRRLVSTQRPGHELHNLFHVTPRQAPFELPPEPARFSEAISRARFSCSRGLSDMRPLFQATCPGIAQRGPQHWGASRTTAVMRLVRGELDLRMDTRSLPKSCQLVGLRQLKFGSSFH